MPRGAPDYSNARSGEGLTRLDDMAELAIRLGAPASIDRLGTVVLIEDFERGVSTVEAHIESASDEVLPSSLYSHYGGYTCKLHRQADTSAYAGFSARAAARTAGYDGVEVLFSVFDGDPNLKLYLVRRDGDNAYRFGLRWDGTTKKAYVGSDTDGWTEILDDVRLLRDYPIVHSMKLVGDFATNEYIRVLIDGEVVTTFDDTAYTWESNQPPSLQLTFYNGTGPSDDIDLYVDVAILTQNEP